MTQTAVTSSLGQSAMHSPHSTIVPDLLSSEKRKKKFTFEKHSQLLLILKVKLNPLNLNLNMIFFKHSQGSQQWSENELKTPNFGRIVSGLEKKRMWSFWILWCNFILCWFIYPKQSWHCFLKMVYIRSQKCTTTL